MKLAFTCVLVAGVTAATIASADEKALCLDAASKGQTLRDNRKLIEARDQFRVCARQGCPGAVVSQVYDLQVASPTTTSPAAATLPYSSSGWGPTLSTVTVASVGVTDSQSVGCKQGYLPSAVTTSHYNVVLNPPALLAGGTYTSVQIASAQADIQNMGSDDWVCVTTNGAPPSCSAAPNACSNGSVLPLSLTTPGMYTVSAIACSPNINTLGNSVITTATYTIN